MCFWCGGDSLDRPLVMDLFCSVSWFATWCHFYIVRLLGFCAPVFSDECVENVFY